MRRLAIIGGGSWGTALAVVLAPRFETVRLWVHNPDLARTMRATRENPTFLAGIPVPENVAVEVELESALEGAEILLSVMPSHVVRAVYGELRATLLSRRIPVVSATKGFEEASLLRMSQVIRETLQPDYPVAVLSGPTFAREVAEEKPTAVVAASDVEQLSTLVQRTFSGPTFRVYASSDPVGVEAGGAMKNVIAIGAGMCAGLGLGHNAVAAVITRGLAEIMRLAEILGAKSDTLSGLSGLGDLVLTCTSDRSRNRQVGVRLAEGIELGRITGGTQMVAEGVRSASAVIDLAGRLGVEMPICQEVHAVLNLGRSPGEAIANLMTRSLRREIEKR